MSLMMSVILLMSTLSFTLSRHICSGRVVDSSIFHEAHKCSGESTRMMNFHDFSIQKNCCHDEQFSFKGQTQLPSVDAQLTAPQPVVLWANILFDTVLVNPSLDDAFGSIEFPYSPPLKISPDLYRHNETFLI